MRKLEVTIPVSRMPISLMPNARVPVMAGVLRLGRACASNGLYVEAGGHGR